MKIVLILVALVVVGGGVFFAGRKGLVRIPGITPAQKAAAAQALYGEQAPSEAEAKVDKKAERKAPPPKPAATKPKKPEPPKADLSKGRRKLAKLWEQLESKRLADVLADWRDDEAAAVLALMDNAKVAGLLGQLDPKRASKLSREIQKAASLPDQKPSSP
ncbi:MAG: hypothetical protein WHU10_11915 [Fimbriimonadales bacterium]